MKSDVTTFCEPKDSYILTIPKHSYETSSNLRHQYSIGYPVLLPEKEIEPSVQDGLTGSWLLFQYAIWNGSTSTPQSVSPNPPQILTFKDHSQVFTSTISDTLLRGVAYYDITYADYPGYLLNLYKKKDGELVSSFVFGVNGDTLSIHSLQQGKPFKFLRL